MEGLDGSHNSQQLSRAVDVLSLCRLNSCTNRAGWRQAYRVWTYLTHLLRLGNSRVVSGANLCIAMWLPCRHCVCLEPRWHCHNLNEHCVFTISAICSSSCSCIIMSSIGCGNAVVSGSSSQSAFTSRAVVVSAARGTSYQYTLSRSDYISVRYHRTSLCVRSTVMEPTVNRRTHKISLPGRLHPTSDALQLCEIGIIVNGPSASDLFRSGKRTFRPLQRW